MVTALKIMPSRAIKGAGAVAAQDLEGLIRLAGTSMKATSTTVEPPAVKAAKKPPLAGQKKTKP